MLEHTLKEVSERREHNQEFDSVKGRRRWNCVQSGRHQSLLILSVFSRMICRSVHFAQVVLHKHCKKHTTRKAQKSFEEHC